MAVALRWPMPLMPHCMWCSFDPLSVILLLVVLIIHNRFVKILVIEIFSSVLGLFGLIVGLLVSEKAPAFGAKPN